MIECIVVYSNVGGLPQSNTTSPSCTVSDKHAVFYCHIRCVIGAPYEDCAPIGRRAIFNKYTVADEHWIIAFHRNGAATGGMVIDELAVSNCSGKLPNPYPSSGMRTPRGGTAYCETVNQYAIRRCRAKYAGLNHLQSVGTLRCIIVRIQNRFILSPVPLRERSFRPRKSPVHRHPLIEHHRVVIIFCPIHVICARGNPYLTGALAG